MCVAGLNVSPSCGHRWYQLVRACRPGNNLANCTERLQLEGWERRIETCPFCQPGTDMPVHETTHRFLYANNLPGSAASSTPASPEIPGMTRMHRSSSSGTTLSTLSRQSSCSSAGAGIEAIPTDRRNREMNDRLLFYLTTDPHEVLPSARKNYPTYSAAASSAVAVANMDSISSIAGRDVSAWNPEANSIRSASGALVSRNWKKGVRFGKGLFRT